VRWCAARQVLGDRRERIGLKFLCVNHQGIFCFQSFSCEEEKSAWTGDRELLCMLLDCTWENEGWSQKNLERKGTAVCILSTSAHPRCVGSWLRVGRILAEQTACMFTSHETRQFLAPYTKTSDAGAEGKCSWVHAKREAKMEQTRPKDAASGAVLLGGHCGNTSWLQAGSSSREWISAGLFAG